LEPQRAAAALAKVLGSQPFRTSERRRRLLQFLIDEVLAGRGGQLKERVVGVEVFARDASYDVRVDAITRVEMGRLRAKLLEYYATEGAGDEIVIEIPKGGYAPRLIEQRFAQIPGKLSMAPPAAPLPHRPPWILAAAVLGLCLASAALAIRYGPLHVHKPEPEAQSLYLKGRYYWEKRTPDSLRTALDYFTQAIVKDPAYAKPFVGMADCYNLMREFAAMSDGEAYGRALAAARKAVQLDPSSAEAHASLAFSSFWGAWDLTGGEREFRRALALDPNYAEAHHWFATALVALGRSSEGLTHINRAQELRPSSNSILADKGYMLFYGGQREQGTALLKELEASAPDFISPHNYLALIYLQSGNDLGYLTEAKRAAELSQDEKASAIYHAAQAGFDANGRQGMLSGRLQKEVDYYSRGEMLAYQVAATCAQAGRSGEALQYLDAALARHEGLVLAASSDPILSPLRDDPGFHNLLARVAHAAGGSPR
jgi:tetratricopeptide (TPR) repeat protein